LRGHFEAEKREGKEKDGGKKRKKMDGRKHPLPRNKIMLRPWQQIEAAAAVVVVIVVVIANSLRA